MRRWQRLLMLGVVIAALFAPAVLDRDGFPLATYPMYARSRGEVVAVATATGVTPAGETVRLSPSSIGDSDDPLIVAALVRDAVADGTAATANLCGDIARRSAAQGHPFREISVVTETHRVVDHALGRPSLVSLEVHTTCEMPQ